MWRFALLLAYLIVPTPLWAQQTNYRQIVYFDAKNHKLPLSTGASYAVETEYIDSLRAIERWYSAPQKVREVASFSNLKRRWRDGETVTYYEEGSLKRRTVYRNGEMLESVGYYPNHKLRSELYAKKDSITERKCYTENGLPVNCDTLTRRTCPGGKPKSCSATSAVRYPVKALKTGVQGKVTVSFVVSRFGELVDVWIVDSPSPLLNEEAMAAVRRLRVFCPHYLDCEPVDTYYTVSINFRIQ
jgi:TonB family protein